MQNQNQNQNEMKCEGCGQQFSNRNDLQKHRANCSALKAQGGSGQQGQQPLTRGAGGSQNRES